VETGLNFPSPYILFNTIPPCPSATGYGNAAKEEKWRESTLHEGAEFFQVVYPSCHQPVLKTSLELILLQTTTDF